MVGVPWARRTDLTAHQVLDAIFHRYAVVRSGWEWEVPRRPEEFRTGSILGNITGALNCMPNTDGIRRSSAYHLIESLCLCCTDAMAAVSRHGLDLWFRRARFGLRKARVIYNGTEAVSIDGVEE